MRVVLQRVEAAAASRNREVVAAIGSGLVVYVGFARDDDPASARIMAHKIANLRIFETGGSKFGRSLRDEGGEALVLAQFTLCADTSRGRRPNFSRSATPEVAQSLFECFAEALQREGVARVVCGPFGSRLTVDVRNRGPFTVVLDA